MEKAGHSEIWLWGENREVGQQLLGEERIKEGFVLFLVCFVLVFVLYFFFKG